MMRRLFALCAAAAIVLPIAACLKGSPDTHDADVKAITDDETQWNADYKAKDLDKVMSHYVDTAVLMVPGEPALKGKDAIRKDLKDMIADPAMALSFHATTVDVAKAGDLAYTQGTYSLTVTNPMTHQPINDHGSYVTTYRKQMDGEWKAVADIVTSDVPPPGPPPAH